MSPKTPWLYAAWDTVKLELPLQMKIRCAEVAASGAPTAIRAGALDPSNPGKFISHASVGL
jgi:hypothetical protein